LALIAGTHKIRVYSSGEDKLRVQILDLMAQRDLIVNGNTIWLYDSKKQLAQFATLDQQKLDETRALAEEKVLDYAKKLSLDISSPIAVAEYLLAEAQEYANFSVGKDHSLAGRTAYQLILTPQSANSLLARATLSVDSETGLPLAVEIYSVEQENAAFSVRFESVSFAEVDPSIFEFSAPNGVATEMVLPELPEITEDQKQWAQMLKGQLEQRFGDLAKPEILGTGFDSVLYLAELPADLSLELLEQQLFADLIEEVQGGRLFSTPLLKVLLTDSGKLYVGAVTKEYLLRAANLR
jgi:outer membrane lipoprotein-sorting protein